MRRHVIRFVRLLPDTVTGRGPGRQNFFKLLLSRVLFKIQ